MLEIDSLLIETHWNHGTIIYKRLAEMAELCHTPLYRGTLRRASLGINKKGGRVLAVRDNLQMIPWSNSSAPYRRNVWAT